MISKEKITAFLEQYKLQKNIYKEYANTIKFILETLLKNNGFNYQVVFAREKDLEKLQENFSKGKYPQQLKNLSLIKDLAGCRVIFYLESDIQRFITHVYKEFSVIETSPHYSPNDYNAQHFVIHLNKDRLNLTEYSKFDGLRCEIQLTTVLYHAWSEMAHDITYKPQKELSQFDQHAFESLKKQFSDVMQNHIRQASYGFEFIYKQFEKLKHGKKVFDVGFLNGIFETTSNNELYENLSLLRQYVQEFGDKTPKEIDIINILENALNKAKQTEPLPIKRTFGTIEGKNYVYIADICLDILSELRYFHTEKIFKLLIHLSTDSDQDVMKKAMAVLSALASYNLPVLQKIGYLPQLFILDQIKKWDHVKMTEHFEAITEIAGQLLKPSFEGHSMTDYKTFTLRHGPLVVNEELISIRKDTITILIKIFTLTGDLKVKKNIMQTLYEATRTPIRGEYRDDMKQMLLSNTNDLIDFYITILPDAEYEVISVIEGQSHRFARKFGDKDLPQVRKPKKLIAANSDYQMFRVLVGYDRDYLEERDSKKTEKLRRKKIREYITDISDKNFKEWQKRILSVIENYSSSQSGAYQYFSNVFLFGLGKQKPSIALELTQQNEKELEPFLLPLIAGIWESGSSQTAKALVTKWIDSNKHLSVCAALFDRVKEIDKGLMENCLKKSKISRDINALNNLVDSIITNYPKHKGLKSLFVQSIKELTRNNDTCWVNHIWYRPESILDSLTEKEYDVILKNLILIPRVDYHVETVLFPVTEKYPKKVIGFFYNRVKKKADNPDDFSYDAIPFDLHKINEPLQKHAKVVLNKIIKWYSEKTGRFEWEASHLIQAIFPSLNTELEKELIRLIKSKNEKNAKIVLSILKAYKGEPFLHNVCKNFVRHSPYVKKFKDSLFIMLSQTGVVSGEYGFVNAYKQKLEEVQPWKKDRSRAIKAFLKEYEDYLNKQIAFAQKRAGEDIELRKREYGEPEE
jgi:ppGpp synthetase/RelA/SpoT-type nucleotidyltranferase